MLKALNIQHILLIAACFALITVGCGKKQANSSGADSAATGQNGDSIEIQDGHLQALTIAEASKKTPYSLKEGRRLFRHYCAVCHGQTGDGFGQYYGYSLQPKPTNFTDSNFVKTRSDELLMKSISNGTISIGKSNMCPPWGSIFHVEEIEFLIAYIKTLSQI